MVSTDVLEEGMDITTCNLVIRFDEITTFRLASFDFTRFFPFLIFHRYLDRAARYIFGFKEVFKYYLVIVISDPMFNPKEEQEPNHLSTSF